MEDTFITPTEKELISLCTPRHFGAVPDRTDVVTELELAGTLRVGATGTRTIVMVRTGEFISWMALQGWDGDIPLARAKQHFLRISSESIRSYCQSGRMMRHGTCGPTSLLYVPLAHMMVEKTMASADITGFKTAVFTKADVRGLAELKTILTAAAGRGKPMPIGEMVAKALKKA